MEVAESFSLLSTTSAMHDRTAAQYIDGSVKNFRLILGQLL